MRSIPEKNSPVDMKIRLSQVGTLIAALLLLAPPASPAADAKIRVLVWDERQAAQKQAYTNFLGNAIAEHLRQHPGFEVRSVALDDPDQGLGGETLAQTDVLVWWGHQRQRDVKWETGDRIVGRVKEGKLGLIVLHSAHWSTPFITAMNERSKQDALKSLTPQERAACEVVCVAPRAYEAPKRNVPLTPSWIKKTSLDGAVRLEIKLPLCVFPAYRGDGKPGHLTTLLPHHPIAAGLPEKWEVTQTEMYDDPFHVPVPDEVVFEERWDAGEHFRSGCVWNLGKGRVFYFRPGHETYPVYREALPLKVVENAVAWLGGEVIKGR